MSLNFYTALSGIKTAEHLINVSQNNISNAKNPSYARQVADVKSGHYINTNSGLQIGSGSAVDRIQRVVDELTIHLYRSENGKESMYSSMNKVLRGIEDVFSEQRDNSLTNLIQNIFNGFEEASKFPEQSSYRVNAISELELFTNKVLEISNHMSKAKEDIDIQIKTEIKEVKSILDEISVINKKMMSSKTQDPNTLLDERDRLIDKLSDFMDIDISIKNSVGDLQINAGGVSILSGDKVANLTALFDPKNEEWVLGANNIEMSLKSGSLKGLLNLRNDIIPGYEKDLNHFVETFAETLNDVHRNGFGLDGTTGIDIFTGTDARTISVNEEILKNPQKLGLSSELGVSGNSDIAKQLHELADESTIGGLTFGGYLQEFSVGMAENYKNSINSEETHGAVKFEAESQRQSIQGVDIDEELIMMNNYQNFYQANARSLKIIDGLLDEVLNLI